MPEQQPLNLVLIEDNDDHITLVRKTLLAERVANTLTVFQEGESALSYLKGGGAPATSLVLLDINLPGIDGLEVLRIIRADPDIKRLPVVVLSTSDARMDRRRAYDHGANSYLVKPLDFSKFRQMIRDVGLYWSVWNRPPG